MCERVVTHDRWVVAEASEKGPTFEKVKEAFGADMAPAQAALSAFEAKLEVLGGNVTPAEAAQAAAPLAAACRKLDGELTALHATGRVGKDIRTFVDEDAKVARVLGSARTQERPASPRGPRRSLETPRNSRRPTRFSGRPSVSARGSRGITARPHVLERWCRFEPRHRRARHCATPRTVGADLGTSRQPRRAGIGGTPVGPPAPEALRDHPPRRRKPFLSVWHWRPETRALDRPSPSAGRSPTVTPVAKVPLPGTPRLPGSKDQRPADGSGPQRIAASPQPGAEARDPGLRASVGLGTRRPARAANAANRFERPRGFAPNGSSAREERSTSMGCNRSPLRRHTGAG